MSRARGKRFRYRSVDTSRFSLAVMAPDSCPDLTRTARRALGCRRRHGSFRGAVEQRIAYGEMTLQENRCLFDTTGETFTLKLLTPPSIEVTWTTAFGVM